MDSAGSLGYPSIGITITTVSSPLVRVITIRLVWTQIRITVRT